MTKGILSRRHLKVIFVKHIVLFNVLTTWCLTFLCVGKKMIGTPLIFINENHTIVL